MKDNVKICAMVIVITLLISLFILVGVRIANKIHDKKTYSGYNGSIVFKKAKQKNAEWFFMSETWLVVEYLGVILPFEFSAAVLFIEVFEKEKNNHSAIMFFSILSMVFIILVYSIRPHEHMRGYRQAYVQMDNKINSYLIGGSKEDEILVHGLNEGELLINGGFEIESLGEDYQLRAGAESLPHGEDSN